MGRIAFGLCSGLTAQGGGGGGGGGGVSPPFATDLFKAVAYTGDGNTSRSIPSGGVSMAAGGLVIIKSRGNQSPGNIFTPNGASPQVFSGGVNLPASAAAATFDASGINLTDATYNANGVQYMAYFYRKAARFLDIVTFTGNGAVRNIAHSLTNEPSLMIVRKTDNFGPANGYHRNAGPTMAITGFGPTGGNITNIAYFNDTSPTAAQFTLGNSTNVNGNGENFVAILWAHDTAMDAAVSACGWTGTGITSGPSVTSPPWQPTSLITLNDSGQPTAMFDQTRSPGFTGAEAYLPLSDSFGEQGGVNHFDLLPGGFQLTSTSAVTNGSGAAFYGLSIRQ